MDDAQQYTIVVFQVALLQSQCTPRAEEDATADTGGNFSLNTIAKQTFQSPYQGLV
jgi:hypothetical protein